MEIDKKSVQEIKKSFSIFYFFSVLMFLSAGYNIGATNGHLQSLFIEGLVMMFSGIGFLLSISGISKAKKKLDDGAKNS